MPVPGKLLERLVHAQLSNFLEDHNVLSDKQGFFRKGFSTARLVAELTDGLFSCVNDGKTALAVFVDLRKAFDTMNHNILLQKLHLYGVRGNNLRWCKSYLGNRSQATLANGKLSCSRGLVCGVPQGSVLGPLFFILYINDMQSALMNRNIQLYADDTVINATGSTPELAAGELQLALHSFAKWCKVNKLFINASKTKQMVFGTRHRIKRAKHVKLTVNGTELQVVPPYKYLGFLLDSTLSFNCHVKTVSNMVSFKVSMLGKIRKYLMEDIALKIYKIMILPYLDYGDVIYGTASEEGLEKLQRLQDKCLKICKGYNMRFGTKELHLETKTPMLQSRRSAHVNNFMYSRLSILVDNQDLRTRAHDAALFMVKTPILTMYKRSIGYAGSVQWDSLPTEVGLNAFKNKQKLTMLQTVRA